jgi:hypothetical protein
MFEERERIEQDIEELRYTIPGAFSPGFQNVILEMKI